MNMPDKLELIAQCLRDGVEVQYNGGNGWKKSYVNDRSRNATTIWYDYEYRAKPVKPRFSIVEVQDFTTSAPGLRYRAVQLTPEVKEALENAGIAVYE
jgi:hypothetical protein